MRATMALKMELLFDNDATSRSKIHDCANYQEFATFYHRFYVDKTHFIKLALIKQENSHQRSTLSMR